MNMKTLKISAQLLLFMFVLNPAFAQEEIQWTFVQETDSVRLFYAVSSCGPEKKLLLMVSNSDATPKRVSVKVQLVDALTPQDLPEGIFHVPANSAVAMQCQNVIPHLQGLQVNVVHDDASVVVSSIDIQDL